MADSVEDREEDVCDSVESMSDVVSDGEDGELADSTGDKSGLFSLMSVMLKLSIMLCLLGSSDVLMLFKFMSLSIMFSWTEWPNQIKKA